NYGGGYRGGYYGGYGGGLGFPLLFPMYLTAEIMRGTSLDIPAGSFKSDDHMLLVRADASVWEPSDVEALMLRDDVRLGMVARAYYGPADAFNYVRINGRQIVGVGIVRRAQANTIDISDGVAAAVARVERRLSDIEIVTISDDAHFIRSAVREVAFSLMIAVGIVIGTLYLFVGSWRPTLLPAAAIPVALTGTLAAIYLLGFSINIMTLLALVLATGIIVDDAIVVVENIDRQRRRGIGSMAAAVLGTRQVFFAVIATTATLVSVFLPIAFLPSQAGRMFTEFGFVLAIAVAISSFVALTLVPMLAARLPDQPDLGQGQDGTADGTLPMSVLSGRGLGRVLGRRAIDVYARALDWALSARTLVVGSMVLVALAAIGVFTTLDEQLLPREDRGEILVYMQGPDGVGLDYMDRQAVRAEAILTPYLESGEVQHVFSIVGRWDPNRVFLAAPLIDWEDRERTQDEIVREIRQPLREIPGATARVWQPNSLGLWRSGGRVEFALTGPRHQMIAAAANDFLELIEEELPGLENPDVEFQQTQPQLTVQVDRRRAEDLGVDVEEITATLRAMVDGLEVAPPTTKLT
ncbi:MAG: efflux RND transporter permease subunit, partial [Pseudomonadota bacterium]